MPATLHDGRLRFTVASLDDSVRAVSLEADRAVLGPREFTRTDDAWVLDLPAPPPEALWRIEYRLACDRDSVLDVVLDPDNPLRVETAFGARSVAELPAYESPWWLTAPATPGRIERLDLDGETLHQVPVTIWSPTMIGDGEPAPLLFVHDGPEYDALARITQYSGALIQSGVLPPHRLALAEPVLRDAWYSGSPRYLRTVAHAGLERIGATHPIDGPVAVMGASLGGLTALLLGLSGSPRVGAVFAQSGSFFQVRHDDSESSYPYFGRIARAVQAVLDARHADHQLIVGMTCGVLEENAANNRDMAAALRRVGHDVTYREVPDLHTYTGWRDALDPTLTHVLRTAWADMVAGG